MRTRIAAVMVVGALFAAGLAMGACGQRSQGTVQKGMDVLVFIDFSASLGKADRQLFEDELTKQIIPSLSLGDRLLIGAISDRTLTNFRPLVEGEFPDRPTFNGWFDNALRHNQRVRDVDAEVTRLRSRLTEDVKKLFAQSLASVQTDIFSSLILAQKLFHDQERRKVLVLMSDMIEDYPPYRFDRITWQPGVTDEMLTEIDAKGLIPDLTGVCVYVSGISAKSAELAKNIGDFWQAYFARTGADLNSSRYAHVLLHWPPAKGCGEPGPKRTTATGATAG